MIIGELHNEEYRDKDGNKRSFVKVEDVEVYSIKEYRGDSAQSEQMESTQQSYDAPSYAKNSAPSFEELRGDDDLPF